VLTLPLVTLSHPGVGGFPCSRCFRLAVPCRIQMPKDEQRRGGEEGPPEEAGGFLMRAVVDRCTPAGERELRLDDGTEGGMRGECKDLTCNLNPLSPPPQPHTHPTL
jgi:hypothetical protein